MCFFELRVTFWKIFAFLKLNIARILASSLYGNTEQLLWVFNVPRGEYPFIEQKLWLAKPGSIRTTDFRKRKNFQKCHRNFKEAKNKIYSIKIDDIGVAFFCI